MPPNVDAADAAIEPMLALTSDAVLVAPSSPVRLDVARPPETVDAASELLLGATLPALQPGTQLADGAVELRRRRRQAGGELVKLRRGLSLHLRRQGRAGLAQASHRLVDPSLQRAGDFGGLLLDVVRLALDRLVGLLVGLLLKTLVVRLGDLSGSVRSRLSLPVGQRPVEKAVVDIAQAAHVVGGHRRAARGRLAADLLVATASPPGAGVADASPLAARVAGPGLSLIHI